MHINSLNVERFVKWLALNGHQVLATTNEYEVARFKNSNGGGIIYKRKNGRLTLQGLAEEAVKHFADNASWPAPEKKKRKPVSVSVATLLKRDGAECFYCAFPLGDDITKEHLLSINSGGSNHLDNLVLAHQFCNQRAGSLPLTTKIKLREEMRAR